VKVLVDAGPDLELLKAQRRAVDGVPVRGPLHLATQVTHGATVRVLVDAGADLEAGSVLHAAARKCSLDMTRILLESGADASSVFSGESAISYARKRHSQHGRESAQKCDNIIKTLEDYGADSQRQLRKIPAPRFCRRPHSSL
jgi:hypothetical protein